MRILCTADLHIGRTSSHSAGELDGTRLTARAVWLRLVELAVAEKVDAVAVAGDVIDASGNYFEAFDPLETGLRKLAEANIESYFVAGNHDFDSLPRFFDQLNQPRAHLLGRGGVWERHTLQCGGERMHIDGWSFRAAQQTASSLPDYRGERDGVPVLGLLHADLEQPYSRYGPCAPSELWASGPELWLLGHVHRPRQLSQDAKVAFYPGSPQALDPGEQGAHGVWLVDWPVGRPPTLALRPLSTIRYEEVELSVEGHNEETALEAALHREVERILHESAADAGPLAFLNCRVRLHGRTRLHGHLARYGWPNVDQLRRSLRGITAMVEKVEIDTRPVLELETLAKGNSPVGLLARVLLALDAGEDHRLITAAQQRLATAFQTMPVEGDGATGDETVPAQVAPDAPAVRALLLKQGHRLLAQMVEGES